MNEPEMSREEREMVREVEEQIAAAANVPDITGADGEVLVAAKTGDAPDEIVIPEGQPQNFREMTYWMLGEVANGNVLVGWHPSGVAWFTDAGMPIEDGVEIVDADHQDMPVLVGIMMMQLVGQSQAMALKEAAEAQRMIAAEQRIVVPGRAENRKVRRERERQAAKADRRGGLIVPPGV
ncbi:MAG TPA: hypothetical protein VMX12_08920 [Acidimicrobiia bacterium]|nr:hypothetical protein [Acidimicrobiia bacterium]